MSRKIVDKRPLKGTSGNRERVIRRLTKEIKKSIPDIIAGDTLGNITSGKGSIKIPVKGVKEPKFKHNPDSGESERVLPGNKDLIKGDKLGKPPKGGGRGNGDRGRGDKDGQDGEDDFTIILSKEEFMKYFFDDLELPNFIKKILGDTEEVKYERAGYTIEGPQSRLNIGRSFKNSMARRIGITSSLKKKIKELKEALAVETLQSKRKKLEDEIEVLERRLKNLLFFEEIDLRFNHWEKRPQPISKACMICIMDVSGSMGYDEKDIAKRFFLLLYLFLQKNYEKVELVFIRHTTEAIEVNEEDFFNSRISGGTLVLPALQLANSIIDKRFPLDEWNIYISQCSDGDVWGREDAVNCKTIVEAYLLKKVQFMSYIDIKPHGMYESELLTIYGKISNERFTTKQIKSVDEIWTVFRKLFEKQKA